MPTGSSFTSDDAGGGLALHAAEYGAAYDIAASSTWTRLSWERIDPGALGDPTEILDLSDPEVPLASRGVYIASGYVYWEQEEAGKSADIAFDVGGNGSGPTLDLGVSGPYGGAAVGAGTTFSQVWLFVEDDSPIVMEMRHDLSVGNLTGVVILSIVSAS